MDKHTDKLNEHGELQELKHDAWPGYKKIFLITFAIFTIYLAGILMTYKDQRAEKHGNHDEKHETPDTKHEVPDTKHKTPDTKHEHKAGDAH
ncbi:MAG: hypothetical protein HRT89_04095 [Lentisphaeria bacterium]|nr:hypothetical protein [Lentisphaeria bacterium]